MEEISLELINSLFVADIIASILRLGVSLSESFSRVEYLHKAKELGIPERTADKQIKSFCTKGMPVNVQHGKYEKG